MLRIIPHIERLLFTHDCVIIPRIGGFVLQDRPAVFSESENRVFPSRKEIIFNPTLQHNDGLLAESYMKSYGVEYAQASLMVADDVCELQRLLTQQVRLSLGLLGEFRQGEEGRVIFDSGSPVFFGPVSYGLAEFSLPTWQSLLEEKTDARAGTTSGRRKDVVYIPVSKRFLRTAVASAAAAVLFFVLSTPVTDVDSATYTASFVPAPVVMNTVPAVSEAGLSLVTPAATASGAEEPGGALGGNSEQAVRPAPADGRQVPVASQEPVAAGSVPSAVDPAPVRQNTKFYHIVIGSFPTRKQADSFLGRVDKTRFTQAGIIERDGKARIYAAKFPVRSEAEKMLEEVRSQGVYKDAWLFISR